MPGEHNVQNSLAAIAVARELGVERRRRSARRWPNFDGVGRRFTKVGEWNGAAIIDDYAHNPFKIAAALKAARQAYTGPIVAVVQPHRYTRLRDTFEQFAKCLNDADVAIDRAGLCRGRAADRRHQPRQLCRGACAPMAIAMSMTIDGEADLAAAVAPHAKPGGAIVCLGAGSITAWVHGLQAAMKSWRARRDDDPSLRRASARARHATPTARR